MGTSQSLHYESTGSVTLSISAADVTNNRSDHVASPLETFETWYAGYHGFVSLVVCTFGIISNMFNIAVLTRKGMRTPTNLILTGLAVADMLTMMSYVPFAFHFRILHNTSPTITPERDSYGWIAFLLFHANFAVTTHTASIFVGVVLAVFRYAYIRASSSGYVTFGMEKAFFSVMFAYALSVVFLIPNYLAQSIVQETDRVTNKTYFRLDGSLSEELFPNINQINFWIHAIAIKITPCIFMTVFGGLLLHTIRQTTAKGREMQRFGSNRSQALKSRLREHSRTTRMLVVVIILFLFTEFPQGVLALLSGVHTEYFESVYSPLGDLMDIVALINNSINFILYCSMSKSFRQAFLCLICSGVKKWRNTSVMENSREEDCTCNQYTQLEMRNRISNNYRRVDRTTKGTCLNGSVS
ncbi:sex peptide receptor [Lingula anatina]|uniref:Sex peptide receptor n=1 Tax=Lingula anatina TaxID=7574 RepID=A0A1S3K1C9_LINAN|nr:sex peptide receptor [Lingula anatina]XP_013416435.1 sex peptide receptor [Lingula anatina]XP_013416436.1 sex peptide receptor [Lingula anatina]XP_013416437.1 sex peptide receptor [Lingula anatina]|eukprot:XP_013416434.1 sex peptide receptor [Lingula anatina]